MQEWSLELLGENTCDEITVKYVDFVRDTAAGKVSKVGEKLVTPFEKTKLAAYALSAMAPRMRLCAFISAEISKHQGLWTLVDPDMIDHRYRKWLDYYASHSFVVCLFSKHCFISFFGNLSESFCQIFEEFSSYLPECVLIQDSAKKAEDLLDRLSAALTGEEVTVVEKFYHKALKLEVDFFAAQPVIQPTVVPLIQLQGNLKDNLTIFCDFDMTCTAFDSSAILAEIAILTAPKVEKLILDTYCSKDGSEPHLHRMSSEEIKSTLGNLSHQYAEEYNACLENTTSSEPGIIIMRY